MIIYISILLIFVIASVLGFIYYQGYQNKKYLMDLDLELINLVTLSNFVLKSNNSISLKPENEINQVIDQINQNNEKWLKVFDKRTSTSSDYYGISTCRDNRLSQTKYLIEDVRSLITLLKNSKDRSHLDYFLKKFNYNKVFFPSNVIDFNKIDSNLKTPEILILDQELMEFAKLRNFVDQTENGTTLRETSDILKLQDVIHLNINKWTSEMDRLLNQNDQFIYDQSGYKSERRTYGETFLISIEQLLREESNPDVSSPQYYLKRFVGDFPSKYFKTCLNKCKGLY